MPNVAAKATSVKPGERRAPERLAGRAAPRINRLVPCREGGDVGRSRILATVRLGAAISFRSVSLGAARQIRAHGAYVNLPLHAPPEDAAGRERGISGQFEGGAQIRLQELGRHLARDAAVAGQAIVGSDALTVGERIRDLEAGIQRKRRLTHDCAGDRKEHACHPDPHRYHFLWQPRTPQSSVRVSPSGVGLRASIKNSTTCASYPRGSYAKKS